MNETKRRLVQKGNKIVLKQDVPDIEFTDKQIVERVDHYQKEIAKCDSDLAQAEQVIKNVTDQKERLQAPLKDFEKFHEWALKNQKLKAKEYVDRLLPKLKEEIDADTVVTHDDGLTEEQELKQLIAVKYRKLQQKLATHPDVASSLASITIRDLYYDDSIIPNPWK